MMQRLEPCLSDSTVLDESHGTGRPAPARPRMLLPIAVSVLVHGAVLIAMIQTDIRLPEPTGPTSIRISFVPELVPAEPAQVPGRAPPADNRMQDDSSPVEAVETTPIEEIALPGPPAEAAQMPVQAPAEESERPRLQPPTNAELRTAVNGTSAQQSERALQMHCDTMQRRNPLFDCAEQDNADFSVLDASIVADYFARGPAEAPLDTGEGFTDARQAARALRMTDTINRTHITRDRVMGIGP